MNNPMPAAPTAQPRDTPLVPLSRGCAGEKGGGETNREERKREGAVGGERQIGRKEKGKVVLFLVTTLQRPHPSRALSSPHLSSSGGLPWDAEPAKPQSSPSEAPLTAGCGPHTSTGSRTSLSSQPLDAGPVAPRREPYGPHSRYRARQPSLVWSLVNISAWQRTRGLSLSQWLWII